MVNEAVMRVYNKTLDPSLWDEQLRLDTEVRLALLKIGKDFYKETDLMAPIVDILFIGSSANYNWTPQSDLDVHVVIDISHEGINPKYARKFMDSLGWSWNSEHDIEIKDHPVEIYLQDQTEKNGSPATFRKGVAVYSLLKGQWIVLPKAEDIVVDKDKVRSKYEYLRSQIEKLASTEDYDGLKALMKKIKNYRNSGLQAHGEFGTENLVFKALRHTDLLEKLKNALKTSYDRMVHINEVEMTKRTYIVTGTTAQDLDVAGEKYYEDQEMITHGYIRAKYGNWSGSKDWRYRSDINTIMWWALPDEDERQATFDWLKKKYGVSRPPKEVSAQATSERMKELLHYPWLNPKKPFQNSGIFSESEEPKSYYVVGAVTGDLNIIAKRYEKRDNYITHEQLKQQYGINFGAEAALWRYHSFGNWIFWWEHPTPLQMDEVKHYLQTKFGIVNFKNEYPDTIEKGRLREAKNPKLYLVTGLVNSNFQIIGKRDYGNGDDKGTYSVEHADFEADPAFRAFDFDSYYSHWRYKAINNTLYWWIGDPYNEDLRDVVLDYLHTKYNVQNPIVDRNKEHYLDDAHFILETLSEAVGEDKIIYGNIDDDLHVNGVKTFPGNSEDSGNHSGEGKRWRLRTTLPYIFWWDDPTEEEKNSVEHYLYTKFGVKINKHRNLDYGSPDRPEDPCYYLHGMGKMPDAMKEAKYNIKKAKELQFVTYGGLSLTKQRGYDPNKFQTGTTFHAPPARRGIYAFVFPYIEKFLLGGQEFVDPKIRGKGQRDRIRYVRDKQGNIITSDHPEYQKYSDIQKNWSLARRKPGAPIDPPEDAAWDDLYQSILYNNANRKKFTYNGPLWHHLKDGVTQDKILDEKGPWIKTDMETYREALRKDLHQMNITRFRDHINTTLDHMEVFIDQKI